MNEELYRNIGIVWLITAVITFIVLLFLTAPYGRHTSKNWGPLISNRLGWIFMESFVLLVLFYTLWYFKADLDTTAVVMIGLFTFHYLNRSFVFPFRLKSKGKKMPVIIMLSAMFFNLINGWLMGYYFARIADYPAHWFSGTTFIAGLIIFITGLIINWQSDHILINLRKPGETGYKIPQGGLFKWISCPNLFGECIEWLGFAILTWSLPGLLFFVWTCANVIPRAVSHHKWYLENFEHYPKTRKAVIPYLW